MRIGLAIAALILAVGVGGPAEAQGRWVSKNGSKASPEDTARQSDIAIASKYAQQGLSGVVLVAKNGKVLFREGFGLADRDAKKKALPGTVFRLGSITKQFTAASIMQLAEKGKLSVDDPVSKYYANAPAAWSKVTIKHLLSHRSGIPSYTDVPTFVSTMGKDLTPEQIIEMTRDMPLQFEPGTAFNYSNSGYIVLGYIIEKVSGETYANYVQNHIFKPLDMKHSGYEVAGALPKGYAVGYRGANTAPYISMTQPYSAGSLYSTVDDLLDWEKALFGDKVVSKASREAMMTDQGNGYGYGLQISALEGHPSIAHGGGIPGFSAFLSRFPADDLTIIVLANVENGPAGPMANELARAHLGLPPRAAAAPPVVDRGIEVKPEILDRYAGVYEMRPGFNVTMRREGGTLASQGTGQSEFVMTAVSETEFRFAPGGIIATFEAGAGPAQSVTIIQGGAPRVLKRITP